MRTGRHPGGPSPERGCVFEGPARPKAIRPCRPRLGRAACRSPRRAPRDPYRQRAEARAAFICHGPVLTASMAMRFWPAEACVGVRCQVSAEAHRLWWWAGAVFTKRMDGKGNRDICPGGCDAKEAMVSMGFVSKDRFHGKGVILVPGLFDSSPTHWQSLWGQAYAGWRCIRQDNWTTPECEDWPLPRQKAISSSAVPVILVGHSLGCSLIVHWAHRHRRAVHGALLVAPPDVEAPAFPAQVRNVSPVRILEAAFPEYCGGKHGRSVLRSFPHAAACQALGLAPRNPRGARSY